MEKEYRILIRKDGDGYSGHCIEIPQAIGQGDTEKEAIEDIKKAIEICQEYLDDEEKFETPKMVSVRV